MLLFCIYINLYSKITNGLNIQNLLMIYFHIFSVVKVVGLFLHKNVLNYCYNNNFNKMVHDLFTIWKGQRRDGGSNGINVEWDNWCRWLGARVVFLEFKMTKLVQRVVCWKRKLPRDYKESSLGACVCSVCLSHVQQFAQQFFVFLFHKSTFHP